MRMLRKLIRVNSYTNSGMHQNDCLTGKRRAVNSRILINNFIFLAVASSNTDKWFQGKTLIVYSLPHRSDIYRSLLETKVCLTFGFSLVAGQLEPRQRVFRLSSKP
ncbi:hypothetical protein XENOCAPTIV_007323 [Xenoophorus captivus]|uniref:Uncharacterized protein n=1 Tax=Xenoophorus captivus TaxID=1517983 RepID=A0ABV0QRC5_9TELE